MTKQLKRDNAYLSLTAIFPQMILILLVAWGKNEQNGNVELKNILHLLIHIDYRYDTHRESSVFGQSSNFPGSALFRFLAVDFYRFNREFPEATD